eukprot:m.69584 g.69584  ORF g.69584 m.69584 type:complete len:379 (+) comp12068_c0_seq7:303-1439(+)
MGSATSKTLSSHPEAAPFSEVCPDKNNQTVRQSYKSSNKKGDLIGEGGYSKVRLGVHLETKKKVAIKVTSDKDKDARTEVELLMFLGEHKNIVHLFECYRYSKKLYLVFEYYDQGDLMDLLLEKERMDEDDARRVARDLFSAVDFIHSHNIAHRDIKGENVLFRGTLADNTLVCKLADFGAATYFAKHNELHFKKIGSSCYVAPEVLTEEYYPAKADMWSLGATIFTMLNGDPPFHGPVHDLIIQRVLTTKLELPVTITSHLSTCGQHFIMSLMTRYAWKRPMTPELRRHPWVKDIPTAELPEMEVHLLLLLREYFMATYQVPSPENPDIPENEILRNPAVHSDTFASFRRRSRMYSKGNRPKRGPHSPRTIRNKKGN